MGMQGQESQKGAERQGKLSKQQCQVLSHNSEWSAGSLHEGAAHIYFFLPFHLAKDLACGRSSGYSLQWVNE